MRVGRDTVGCPYQTIGRSEDHVTNDISDEGSALLTQTPKLESTGGIVCSGHAALRQGCRCPCLYGS